MSNQITDGPIAKPLLTFFFPILLGTFFQQLYNTVDAIIVGNFVGTAALAAVGGSTSFIINFLINLFVGISTGSMVTIARDYGARRHEDLSKTIHTGFALTITAGITISVVGLFIARPVLTLMGTPDDVMPHALTYLRIYFCGTTASCIYNMGASVLRGIGDTRRPLYFLMAACMTNIALDLLFVVVFDWGVLGVGLATITSQVVSAALVIRCLRQPGTFYHLEPKDIKFHPGVSSNILRIGLPTGLQSNMYIFSNIILQSCINSLGTTTVAAWTAHGKVDNFYWMVGGALGVAMTNFVSQNFGSQNYDRIKKGVRVGLGISFAITISFSLVFTFFSRYLLQVFTPDADVIALGTYIMYFFAPFYFTFVCIEIFSAASRGVGESLTPMLMTCGGVCCLRVIWVFLLFPRYHYLETVLISYPLSWAVTAVLFIIYYLRGNWLKKGIARMEAYQSQQHHG